MWGEIRYALRMFVQQPGTSAAIVVLLATSIAGSVATFCVADAILWHPVPFRDPDRLVNIHGYHPAQPNQISVLSRMLETWPARDQILSAVHVWSVSSSVIDLGDQVVAAGTAGVSPGLITELGVSVLGRDFVAADVGQRVAILSEEFARVHFQNPRDALGRFVQIDGDPFTIVGVAPRGFAFPLGARSAWMPMPAGPLPVRVRAIARVRNDLTFPLAAELTAATSRGNTDRGELRLVPLVSAPASTSQAIVVSLAAALCLLIVGIANASNLVLGETVQRRGEMAVRRALGASSLALTRQVLVETTLRTAVALILGLLVLLVSLDTIASGVPRILTYQSLRPMTLDWRALAFAAVISALTACAAAIAPCLQILHGNVQGALQSVVPQVTVRSRMRDGLTIVQLAATLMLLGAAGALVNGFIRLMSVNPGYGADGVTVVMLRLPSWKYNNKVSTEAALQSLESKAISLPGVLAASIADGVPPYTSFQAAAEIETGDGASLAGSNLPVGFVVVDDSYFATLRIPVLSGAGLTRSPSIPSVVITKSLADHLWPGRDPLERRLRLSAEEPWLTVVGVCGDIRLGGFDQPLGTFAAFINRAASSTPYSFQMLVARSALSTRSIEEPLRDTVARTLPGVAVTSIQGATELIANERSRVRFVTQLMSALGFVAIVVSMIGVYGAFWCAVNQRRREIGVRLAVGAAPGTVVRMIIVESLRIVATAIAIGLPFALLASFVVKPFLFEVSPADPATIVTVVLMLSGCALAAAYLPARHASRIDPVETLRTQ